MRVIAGSARGRSLRAPTSERTRPTGDKIKGVVFSMLEAEAYRRGVVPEPGDDEQEGKFAAAVCWPRALELYAGSGALGIEALSRGAERVDLVESDAAARKTIAENLEKTGLAERATIHRLTSEAAVSTLPGPYDLILLDPPYEEPNVEHLLGRLIDGRRTSPHAALVWEHRGTFSPPEWIGGSDAADEGAARGLRRVKTNAHGAAAVSLYVMAAGG